MAAVTRWFTRCTTCLAVAAIDEHPTSELRCGICNGQLENMGRVERERLVHEHLASVCDDRCTFAKGPICNCKCGGEHHGSKRVVRVVRDAGPVPTVAPASGRDQARLNAEEYRHYRAAALAELDPLLEQRRSGWLETPRYDRLRNLQAALRKAAESRDHRARMRALRAVVPIQSSPAADLARAIDAAPKVAEAPFTLTATAARREQPKQTSLF
jgi:hypothetical protein